MKRILSLGLCIVLLLLPLSSAAAYATDGTQTLDVHYESEIYTIQSFDPLTEIEIPESGSSANKIPFFSAEADAPHLFYSYLDENQKELYNAVKNNPFSTSFTVALPTALESDCQISGSNVTLSEDLKDQLMQLVTGGLSAVADDNPMIFWISGYRYSFPSVDGFYNEDGTFHTILRRLTIIPSINAAYGDMNTVISTYNAMQAVVDDITIEGYTRYEQVKFIHDFIAARVIYDPNLGTANKNPTDHEATSVFLEPYITVCEGYAEAFKILCAKAGIPCVVVVGDAGGAHAWNYVKMEDGKWYAVDCTWDDQNTIYYDFFLVGGYSTNKHFDNDATTFSGSHTPTGQWYIDGYILTYPSLSPTAYSRMLLGANSTATVSKAKKMLYIAPGTTASGQIVAPFGFTVRSTGNQTGATMTVNNTSNILIESYTVIMRGDVMPNAVVNAADYEALKRASVRDYTAVQQDTPAYEAGDLNADGVVDAFDTALLDQQMNGK